MGAVKELHMEPRRMEISSALELSSLIHVDKTTIQEKVKAAVLNIHDGNIDALEALIYAKKGKELFDLLEKNVRPYAESKQIEKNYTAYNCTVVQRNGAAKPDFTTCNDSEWELYQQQLSSIKEKIAARERFLESLTSPVVNPDTGELISPPVVHYGKIGLALTIK